MQGSEIIAYAHTKEGAPPAEWHLLKTHLEDTAARASRFAAPFQGDELAYYAGLWHDLGKYSAGWQSFLREAGENASELGDETPEARRVERRRGPDHSTAGAIHATRTLAHRLVARALSLTIASHHGGLPDAENLTRRLTDSEKHRLYDEAVIHAPESILDPPAVLPGLPRFMAAGTIEEQKRRYEFFVRMLFSALVDADFLDTEAFLDDHRMEGRTGWPDLPAYIDPLSGHLSELSSASSASRKVGAARADVLRWCTEASSGDRGAFTLTVPTGGGKTLSSLWFALLHARTHGLKRVVIALPFLSILDQTASVLRRIFEPHLGDRVLVEHHSNITPEKDTLRNRLAAENWDVPLVVTTQVQLFESLFARRTSACRKLHNLADSIIVLDEVQTLPVGLLDPILEVLQDLLSNYGTSVLMTTATQPALHTRLLGPDLFRGFAPEPIEVVPTNELKPLFDKLRRVEVNWQLGDEPVEWPLLAAEIVREPQVLAVVHRRADAADLWREVDARAPGSLHLSALMCPAHRRRVLADVRERLETGNVCRVVTTQLVEAGVDLDFPVVYRAMAGFESLAQAAGRCNREGKLERGSFRVFRAPTEPVGTLHHHKQIAETMLAASPGLDLFDPEILRSYFDRLYSEGRNRDDRGVQVSRQSMNYEETASRFRMIDEATDTVFVPFDSEARKAIDAVRYAGPTRDRFRSLQPYSVSVYPNAMNLLRARGAIEQVADSIWILTSIADYHPQLGLLVEDRGSDQLTV